MIKNQTNLESTVNSEIFARILFSPIALKDIFAMLKFGLITYFTYIGKRQGDLASSLGFYFHVTSHMRSYVKIKS